MDPTFERLPNGISQFLKEVRSGELSNEDEEYLRILADSKKHLENLQETGECDHAATLKNVCQAVLCSDYIIVRSSFTVFSQTVSEVKKAESKGLPEILQPRIKQIKGYFAKLSELIKNMDNLVKTLHNKVNDFFERDSKLTEEERIEVEFLNIDFETVVKQTTDYFDQAVRELEMFESDVVSCMEDIKNKAFIYGGLALLTVATGGVLGGVLGAAVGAFGAGVAGTVFGAKKAAGGGFYSSQCEKINDRCEYLNSELGGFASADVGLAGAVAAAGGGLASSSRTTLFIPTSVKRSMLTAKN